MASLFGTLVNKQLAAAVKDNSKDNTLPGGLTWGRGDSGDTDDEEAARARLRQHTAANEPSPLARLNQTLSDIMDRLRGGRHRDKGEQSRPSPSPMPNDRSSVVSVVAALAEAKERLSKSGGHQSSARDLRVAMDTINAATDKTLESSTRMLQLTLEAQMSATDMLVYLDDQLEQLDEVENALGRINGCMHAAEDDLKNLEKCCGLCMLPWNQRPNFEETKEYVDTWQEVKTTPNVNNTTGPTRMTACLALNNSTPFDVFIDRVTDDERELAMNSNIQQITIKLNALCEMVRDINIELRLQNQQLETIHHKVVDTLRLFH